MAKSTARKQKEDRIEIRTKPEVKKVIKTAADFSGSTVSSFVINIAYEAAKRIIAEQDKILASDRDQDIFLAVLLSPPKPNVALQKAAERFRKIYG